MTTPSFTAIRDDARSLQDDLVALRRDLHRTPETGLQLPRTQERVLAALAGLPLEVSTGTDTSSVVAVLRGGGRAASDTATVLLRGDMDALPVVEETGTAFASTNGAMHACGHDLHTSALVGAARVLSQHRDALAGDVVFMFQPGEEGWDGAGVMIREGVLEASGRRVDHAFGMHVFSNLMPSGVFVGKPGPMLSASHGLTVTVKGAGGHGSAPHHAQDPVAAMAEMITTLQTMVTRRFDIFDPVVLTVGLVEAGTKRNVIPDTARFEATVRRFSEPSADLLAEGIDQVLRGVAQAHGVEVEYDFIAEYPLTVNDAEQAAFAADVIRELVGEDRYVGLEQPVSGSEDFSRVLAAVPGAFVGLGACMPGLDPTRAPMNHSPRAEFDDAVLGDATAVYAALATSSLDVTARERSVA
ncbi:putative amidohydrolase [Nostocoides japonicum T1-X7]|uniref:Putative amidohydrolase n=1 Tax=Nostocoides japonicum T1-X7 TaxID=1194083 RepID=A0A077M172_9MICO|nr:M20 family metallopeptidase [Tetrasphaera japonica]CCH80083.1 putative amidohydrolase [Tetrasphaera japonica T1-X7]